MLSFRSTPNAAPPPSFPAELPRLWTSSECDVDSGPYPDRLLVYEDNEDGPNGSVPGAEALSILGRSSLCGVRDRLWSAGALLFSLDDEPFQMRANNPPMRRDAFCAFPALSSDDRLVVDDNDCFPGDSSMFSIAPPMDIDRICARLGSTFGVSRLDRLDTVSVGSRLGLSVMDTTSGSGKRLDISETGRKLGVLWPKLDVVDPRRER